MIHNDSLQTVKASIDTLRMLWYALLLERAARPSGVPSQAPRPAKVLCLAFFHAMQLLCSAGK
ncbi:MAG: hypothetical protein AB1Z31_06785 [Desulfobacterales bacterium]